MSNKHSLGAYRILLQARSATTIMVEGKDDKELMVKLKLARAPKAAFVIDSTDILKDDELYGLGAKAVIDKLLGTLAHGSPAAQKIRCVVDREWETLVDNNLEPINWTPPICTDNRLVTNGHSIENYSFVTNFVIAYLNHFGGGVATPQFIDEVSKAVPNLLNYAAAFSEMARKQSIITRCTGLFDWDDLQWDGRRVNVLPALLNKLESRQVDDANSFLTKVAEAYETRWQTSPFADESQLHAHGHIGHEILWSGIGSIASTHSHSNDTIREIVTGRRDERKRVWHGWMVSQSDQYLEPLPRFFS